MTVAHPALLEELAAFQKSALLAALRQNAPAAVVHDIRFRVGPVDSPARPRSEDTSAAGWGRWQDVRWP